jgi:hypothetical protein
MLCHTIPHVILKYILQRILAKGTTDDDSSPIILTIYSQLSQVDIYYFISTVVGFLESVQNKRATK